VRRIQTQNRDSIELSAKMTTIGATASRYGLSDPAAFRQGVAVVAAGRFAAP
jgi:hypothetical protein